MQRAHAGRRLHDQPAVVVDVERAGRDLFAAGGKIRPAASNKRSENGNGYIMLFLKASGTSL